MTGRAANANAIAANRRAHDALGAAYDRAHPEIFNTVEQHRVGAAVARATDLAREDGRHAVRALDVGCGTGNLTAHLLAAGARVTSADLSARFLSLVQQRFAAADGFGGTTPLNGMDLRPIASGSFDLVATYSVLHHVPDYLTLVREMARVAVPGGVVMIDHERTDDSWTSPEYQAFLRGAVRWPARRWWYWLQPLRYWKRMAPLLQWRRWTNPRWMPEGDLHVWPDDHIEWARVEAALSESGCDVVVREPYLVFEPRYDRDAWERARGHVSDMQLLIARKHDRGGTRVSSGAP